MKNARLVLFAIIILTALFGGLLLNATMLNYTNPKEKLGVCMHLDDFNNDTEAALVDLGVKWVRIDWINGEMDAFMQNMSSKGIKVLAIIDHNTMGQQNFSLHDWENTVSAILSSESAKLVSAWEIWNEPNAGQFYCGYMDGTSQHYFDMLKIAYTIIKNASNNASIVCAGLSPNSNCKDWLDELYNLGAKNYCDAQGVHLYDNLTENLRMIDEVKGFGKPVWVTEIGAPSDPGPNYSVDKQAQYVDENLRQLLSTVDRLFWYELADTTGLLPEKENHFGLVTRSCIQKPSYEKFAALFD